MTVKVPGKDNTQMINGKKICWNYRKGRCRFGHNCKYAHDSDIQKTTEELEVEKQVNFYQIKQKTNYEILLNLLFQRCCWSMTAQTSVATDVLFSLLST